MKKYILSGQFTRDGAGVKLIRIFSHDTVELTDPFLLLDAFGSKNPADYILGFPWHPHRGIETVTYMLGGKTEHEDSIGNKGIIGKGDVQWMTAGSGIYHQEMPKDIGEELTGIQLWVNLPKKSKMIAPRYRGVNAQDIPIVREDGITVKIISGSYKKTAGPVTHLEVDVEYFDVNMEQDKTFEYIPKKGYTTFCYIISGSGVFDSADISETKLVLWKETNKIIITAYHNLHFILVSGKRLNEPIAWGGPIVMNTEKELQKAFQELDEGTFIKK